MHIWSYGRSKSSQIVSFLQSPHQYHSSPHPRLPALSCQLNQSLLLSPDRTLPALQPCSYAAVSVPAPILVSVTYPHPLNPNRPLLSMWCGSVRSGITFSGDRLYENPDLICARDTPERPREILACMRSEYSIYAGPHRKNVRPAETLCSHMCLFAVAII